MTNNAKDFGLVSIVMPMFNDSQFVSASIVSVLNQTYSHFELLIVDDCSSDASVACVSAFSDSRIRLFRNEFNLGAAHSRNLALRNAKGKWVAFLDADDLWVPQKLERQLAFMSEHDYKFSYAMYYEANQQLEYKYLVFGPKVLRRRHFLRCNYPGCLTVMYDASRVGLIQVNETLKKRNDYAIWIQVSALEKCYLCQEVLGVYRRRINGISTISIAKKIKWAQIFFKQCVSSSFFISWFLAFRCATYSFMKEKRYKRRVTNGDKAM